MREGNRRYKHKEQQGYCGREDGRKIFVLPQPPPQKTSKRLSKFVLYHLKGQYGLSPQKLNMARTDRHVLMHNLSSSVLDTS